MSTSFLLSSFPLYSCLTTHPCFLPLSFQSLEVRLMTNSSNGVMYSQDSCTSMNSNPPCFYCTVKELHREFLRAGSDVMQTFTFYASDDKLGNRGNTAAQIGVSLFYRPGFLGHFANSHVKIHIQIVINMFIY